MFSRKFFTLILLLFFGMACSPSSKKPTPKQQINPKPKIVKPKKSTAYRRTHGDFKRKECDSFLFEYQKQALPSLVEISTSFGEITIELFDEAPYHKANFIYLARLGYFNDTFFFTVLCPTL